jgi:hypothetical protein
VPEPADLALTVHPTIESFGRATGQPWWIAAATVDRSIDLLPLTALRQRGILETTLRHEVAHVVLEPALASRPMWVREGLAEHFGNPQTAPGRAGSRPACPTDAELLRPVSAGAQREAYARAVACVRRALDAGTRWSEIR